jgi:hypothetical protein
MLTLLVPDVLREVTFIHIRNKCEFLGFRSEVAEDSVVLGNDDVSMGNRIQLLIIIA